MKESEVVALRAGEFYAVWAVGMTLVLAAVLIQFYCGSPGWVGVPLLAMWILGWILFGRVWSRIDRALRKS